MGGVMASRWHKLLWGSSLMGHNSHINQFPRFSARVALTFEWKVNFLECLLQSTGGHWLIGEPEESLIWHIASPPLWTKYWPARIEKLNVIWYDASIEGHYSTNINMDVYNSHPNHPLHLIKSSAIFHLSQPFRWPCNSMLSICRSTLRWQSKYFIACKRAIVDWQKPLEWPFLCMPLPVWPSHSRLFPRVFLTFSANGTTQKDVYGTSQNPVLRALLDKMVRRVHFLVAKSLCTTQW